MKRSILSLLILILTASPILAAEGLIDVSSTFNVAETATRLESILKEKGMTIFTRIQHSQSAEKVGIELRATELIVFGNPKVGSQLMKCQQSVAIDLPQKALIWEAKNAQVWISYNDPRYLAKRHDISGCDEVISKIEKALAGITKAAAN